MSIPQRIPNARQLRYRVQALDGGCQVLKLLANYIEQRWKRGVLDFGVLDCWFAHIY
jgi:hypothetical protein